MTRLRRYVVREQVEGWAGYVVEARNKAEAVEKVKNGEHSRTDLVGDSIPWPTGRYRVEREDGPA